MLNAPEACLLLRREIFGPILPFGGVGESGMGRNHGVVGFHTFGKLRPVFYQARYSSLKFLWPPFGKLADRVLAFLTR
ncbi:MAG: hypothetical protein KA185_10805 [Vitreoscilla sp.]|nr:hypothetical protein [Vitreoscilla sp.]